MIDRSSMSSPGLISPLKSQAETHCPSQGGALNNGVKSAAPEKDGQSASATKARAISEVPTRLEAGLPLIVRPPLALIVYRQMVDFRRGRKSKTRISGPSQMQCRLQASGVDPAPRDRPEILGMKNFYSLPGRDYSEGGPILGAVPHHPLADFPP